jgi:hypothetical protein
MERIFWFLVFLQQQERKNQFTLPGILLKTHTKEITKEITGAPEKKLEECLPMPK